MSEMYTTESRRAKHSGRKVTTWIMLNAAGDIVRRGYATEQEAQAAAASLNAKPADTSTPAPAGHTGWSRHSQPRRDLASEFMRDSFGLTTNPKIPYECHYCGLDTRTCDCH